jgi:hypothetical protein
MAKLTEFSSETGVLPKSVLEVLGVGCWRWWVLGVVVFGASDRVVYKPEGFIDATVAP